VRAFRWSFPARNRIMAALAELVVVVEAAERSGSLITAELAGELGRGVAAVPGRVTHRGAAGSNHLLRDGARPALGTEDVLDELLGPGAAAARMVGAQPVLDGLRAGDRRVLAEIESGGGRPDVLGRQLALPAGAVRAALGRLEDLGLIARDALGHYERTAS
jgi:DNA processing protein